MGKWIVLDWEQAEPDWRAGTVRAGDDSAGRPGRKPVELHWPELEIWAELHTTAERRLLRQKASGHVQDHGTRPRQNKGGRPPEYDQMAFAAEVIRIANTPDGLPSRSDLHRQMVEWCQRSWGKEPSDSTLRDWLSKLLSG